jgi:phage terminase large subunit-like protein
MPSSAAERALRYATDVVDGTIPASKYIILACKRHLDDLETANERGLWFDEDAAQRVVDFAKFCKPSIGEWANRPIELLEWQVFVLSCIFGWKRADGTRRFREAYIEVPRKNGKSTLLSIIGLYMLVADGEPGAEVYSAACTKEQARRVWDEAVAMRSKNESLAKKIQDYRSALVVQATNSKFLPLASEDSTLDGLNIHCALIDELHEHPTRALYDVLDTATGSRRNPLLFVITTAGVSRTSICWLQHTYAQKVLESNLRDDGSDAFFAYVACLDKVVGKEEYLAWDDEREWAKCNPSLGVSVKIDDLRRKAAKAKETPSALNTFLRKHLNVWTQQETRYLPMDKWAQCGGIEEDADPLKERLAALERLKNKECIGGLDLSTTTDISAFVLVFKDGNKILLMPWFWIPGDNVEKRSKRDKVPYEVWVREGFILTTPGNVIDYDFIRQRIKSLGQQYLIKEIAFDPYNATQIVGQLKDQDGFEMVLHRQGDVSMNMPTKELLRLTLTGDLVHLNNPVLTWMADNLVVHEGATALVKPDKEKSVEKIDGIVAAIMAIGRYNANPTQEFSGNLIEVW